MTSLPDYLQKQAYRYRLEKARSKARPSSIGFTAFKRLLYHRYQHSDHLEQLDTLLTSVARYVETGGKEGVGRAIIAMPPRHGKSLTTSRLFPAWFVGRNPDKRVMLVSYGASLAEKHSRHVRNLIASPRYAELFPQLTLASDSKAADAWDVQGYEGGMDALGIGGAATGKGAHLLIIDDPIKNREQAESKTWREKVWDSFTDDLYTRLEPGAAIIVMATRWHEDDLTGRLLRDSPDDWTTLTLPAIDDNGAALWKERYPIHVLRKIELTLGPYAWASEFQQKPTPAEGGLFKRAWFAQLHDSAPPLQYRVRFWDLAMSEKTSADYTVGTLYGMDDADHRWILDVARGQIDWADLKAYMSAVMQADGPDVAQGIEQKGYMSRAVGELNKELPGYAIFGYDKDTDKVTNALPFAAKCGAGLVHLLNRHWTAAWIDEVCSFPQAAHDDQVDSAAGAENMVSSGMGAMMGGISYGSDDITHESLY